MRTLILVVSPDRGRGVTQDLTGFDPETGQPLRHQRHGDASTSGRGGGAEEGEGEVQYDEDGHPIPRQRKRKSRRKKQRHRSEYAEDDIPEVSTDVGIGAASQGTARHSLAGKQTHKL